MNLNTGLNLLVTEVTVLRRIQI